MSDNDKTYTVNEDKTISVKDSGGNEVRYAKESDLLTVKGSAETIKAKADDVSKAAETASASLATTRQDLLRAEAKISNLETQVAENTGSKEELDKAKSELETAKTSGQELTTKTLEYRRQIIIATYGIPADTVNEKSMSELDSYEEALKAVIATKGIGNYAGGGGGGGQNLEGMSPLALARAGYANKK